MDASIATTTLRADSTTRAGASLEAAAARLAQRAPFQGPDKPRGYERAPLAGRYPEWLRGELVRLAPAIGATPRWAPAHWFDGLGMAFGFSLQGESELQLRWAVLECAMAAAAMSGKVPLAHFASRNQRGLVKRLFQPVPELTDNANVNVVRMGRELVAMTETPHQLLLDPLSLRVRGRVQYDDALAGRSQLAHPIIYGDVVTNVAIKLGPVSEATIYRHDGGSRQRRVLGSWRASDLPYIHTFGMTERRGIIIDHPFRLHPLGLVWTNHGVIDHFSWRAGTPTRLRVIDFAGGSLSTHETDPLFVFHTVHGFEAPDATVLDLLAYDDASIVSALSLPQLVSGFPVDAAPQLTRLSIDHRSGKVTRRVLSSARFELPQVDWEQVGTGEQQLVFGVDLYDEGAELRSRVVRTDVRNDRVQSFQEDGYTFGEPVFVGKPGRTREGDGVLLTVGSSVRGSALYVLDATTLGVLAHADFETPLPLGFHGSFAGA
jgi:carotenoid cleavage dioxygenase-like enzyme